MRRWIAVMAIIGILGLTFMSHAVHAVSPLQLIEVTPSSTAISVDPGASAKQIVNVINVSKTPFKVFMTSSPYHVEGLSYDPKFTQLTGTVDASRWVHFVSPAIATVQSQKLYSIDYTVDVPAGTAPGGYYAVLFATTDVTAPFTAGVVSHARIGDILYITVNGPVKVAGTATATTLPSLIIHTPVSLGVVVGNHGGAHFQTTVEITVKNLYGGVSFTHTARAYILPQTERQLDTTWSPQAPFGIYRVDRTVMLPDGPKHLATQTVIVVKPWVIIVLIVIIVVIVFIVTRHIKRSSSQLKRKPEHEQ